MDVSIIIVSYNTEKLLKQCINSVINFTEQVNYEIIVVDNGSSDKSVEMLKNDFPDVININVGENLGFGKANNLAVKNAHGDFVLLLNSDTILVENSVKIMIDFFREQENELNIGSLGCALVNEYMEINNSGGGFPKVINDLKEYYYAFASKRMNIKFAPRDSYDFSLPFFEIDYVIGADLMMRRSIYEKLNGFDERFFMYYEEADLQFRLRQFGNKCFITTKTKIIHLEGGSVNRIKYSNFKRIVNEKSRHLYFKKNDKKYYPLFLFTDLLIFPLMFWNRNYTLKENINFIKGFFQSN